MWQNVSPLMPTISFSVCGPTTTNSMLGTALNCIEARVCSMACLVCVMGEYGRIPSRGMCARFVLFMCARLLLIGCYFHSPPVAPLVQFILLNGSKIRKKAYVPSATVIVSDLWAGSEWVCVCVCLFWGTCVHSLYNLCHIMYVMWNRWTGYRAPFYRSYHSMIVAL